MSRPCSRQGRGEEAPLQNPRPPETTMLVGSKASSQLVQPLVNNTLHNNSTTTTLANNRCHEQKLMYRAKRWSANLSRQASVMWGGGDEAPPPVPRHRTESKYNAATSDVNHVRLLERRSRAYTCRELMCIVFLPCLLICLLGIACSALVIYYQLDKEYSDEISNLEAELAATRDKSGVFMSSQKYQGLLDQVNRQKLAIDNEKAVSSELAVQLKQQGHDLSQQAKKYAELRQTLDCTWSIIKKTSQSTSSSLLKLLDSECQLSSRAHLLVPINDEAAVGREKQQKKKKVEANSRPPPPPHPPPPPPPQGRREGSRGGGVRHTHGDAARGGEGRQHWLLGSNNQMTSRSNEFQRFLATEFTRMEQNIIDFSNQQDVFCGEFRRSLESEVDRRNRDLSKLSQSLGKMLETQLKTVSKLSSLATDQLYAEQSWVTGHLKTARNEADKQSGTMQGFLTDSLLAWLVQVDVSLRDQANSLDLLQQGLLAGLAGMQTERQEFLHTQKKLLLTANSRVQALSRQQVSQLVALVENEEKVREAEIQFGARFQEAKRKIDGLLESLLSEYQLYSGLINKTSEARVEGLTATRDRAQQVNTLVGTATGKAVEEGEARGRVSRERQQLLQADLLDKVKSSQANNKAVESKLDVLEQQTKQFIGERQGAWELHYSNQEIGLRKKADKNKELLQLHQTEAQDLHSLVRTATNSLETMLESQRAADSRTTGERQADLQAQCKATGTFTELVTSELHARDSDLANYFFNEGRDQKKAAENL